RSSGRKINLPSKTEARPAANLQRTRRGTPESSGADQASCERMPAAAPGRPECRPSSGRSQMGRILAFVYGIAAYVASFLTLLYAIGFVAGLGVPKDLNSGAIEPAEEALIVNLLLLSLFAVQHSVMARPQFKRWWTRLGTAAIERSTYVLLTSLALVLLFWQWRPLPAVLWQIDNPPIALAMTGISLAGWLIVLTSSFLINHFELFGLQQVTVHLVGRTMPEPRF